MQGAKRASLWSMYVFGFTPDSWFPRPSRMRIQPDASMRRVPNTPHDERSLRDESASVKEKQHPARAYSSETSSGEQPECGIGEQCGLVAVDRQEGVATVGDDLLRDVALRQQGISRHHPPRARHLFQDRCRRSQVVACAGRSHLARHRPDAGASAATRYVPGTLSGSSFRFWNTSHAPHPR